MNNIKEVPKFLKKYPKNTMELKISYKQQN